MNKNILLKVEKILGIKFKNINLLEKALIHKSISKLSETNNERLEFIGDRVLGLVIATELSRVYPLDEEGVLDKKLASLVNKKVCTQIVENLNLGKYILLSGSQKKNKIGHGKIFGDLCESLIGAFYLDHGFEEVSKFVLRLWEDNFKRSINIEIDGKTKLQEFSLKKYKELPVYKSLSHQGPSHKPIFKVSVKIPNSKTFFGEGASKQKAEQSAAQKLLTSLNLI
jgi:ribonuclease-3